MEQHGRGSSSARQRAARYSIVSRLRYVTPFGAKYGFGRTVNISTTGILVEIDPVYRVGSRLNLVVDYPGLYHGRESVRLHVSGYVVRVDGRGTALRIVRSRFEGARVAERSVA